MSSVPPIPLPRRLAILVAALAAVGGVAHATLGGAYASVEADRAHLGARRQSLAGETFVVDALTAANGSVLREYVRPDGVVFAVAWEGQARPDLRQALGPYFPVMNAANPPRLARGARHRPLSVDQADLVMRSGGHSGAFWGVAYVPALVPSGVSLGDIR